jgi:hypothetical protein
MLVSVLGLVVNIFGLLAFHEAHNHGLGGGDCALHDHSSNPDGCCGEDHGGAATMALSPLGDLVVRIRASLPGRAHAYADVCAEGRAARMETTILSRSLTPSLERSSRLAYHPLFRTRWDEVVCRLATSRLRGAGSGWVLSAVAGGACGVCADWAAEERASGGVSQAMASAAGEVTLVDVDSGEQGGIVLDGYPGGTLRWSSDGTELECVGLAGESVVWDVQVKAPLFGPSLYTHRSLALSGRGLGFRACDGNDACHEPDK